VLVAAELSDAGAPTDNDEGEGEATTPWSASLPAYDYGATAEQSTLGVAAGVQTFGVLDSAKALIVRDPRSRGILHSFSTDSPQVVP
jgi:hypothetical protein